MRRVLFLLLVGLAGLAVLIALGSWQLRRLDWKQAMLADIDSRIAGAPQALPAEPDPERDRYLPVAVSGTMAGEELHVLVSVKMVGPGYRVIAPFVTDEGRRILVDRGFIPTTAKQDRRETGPMRVEGNLHWPDEIDGYTPAPDRNGNIWFARDVPAMAAELGTEPVLLIARAPTGPGITPLPVDSAGIPNDHLQYAITWFGLALVWAAMTSLFLWRGRARKKG